MVITALVALVLPGYGQDKSRQISGSQTNGNTSTPHLSAPQGAATCVVEGNGTAIECRWPKDEPQGYLRRLLSPENLPNIGLFVVGLIGVIAAFRTLGNLERQIEIAEDTLVQTQRPRLQVRTFYFKEHRSTSFQVPNRVFEGSMMSGQFYIVNLGGTAATIQEVFYEFYIADSKSPLPAKRPWEGKSGLKCNVTLKPGCSSPYLFERQQPVSAEEFSYLAFRKKSLYIMGWIDYVDALKIRRTTRFCRLYDVDTDRFTAVEDAEYESAD